MKKPIRLLVYVILVAGGAAAALAFRGGPTGGQTAAATEKPAALPGLPSPALQTTRPVRPERGPRLPSRFEVLVRPERPDWEPLTATYAWRDGAHPRAALRLTRAKDRAHIAWVDGGQEWLFVRNPLDPAYFEATLADHQCGRIVLFHFSDLRFEGLARTWEGAGNLGLDRKILDALEPTGKTRRAFGLDFEERRRPATGGGDVLAVWWNEGRRIALEVVRGRAGDQQTQVLTSLSDEVDADLLERASTRFPSYPSIDLGDSCDVCGTAHGCGTPHTDSRATSFRHPAVAVPDAGAGHDEGGPR